MKKYFFLGILVQVVLLGLFFLGTEESHSFFSSVVGIFYPIIFIAFLCFGCESLAYMFIYKKEKLQKYRVFFLGAFLAEILFLFGGQIIGKL